MVSLLHEGVIKLVRDHPRFAADLLGDVVKLKVPHFRRAQLVDVTLNELVPVEHRADAVVVFTRRRPVFGVIIEAQIGPDEEKRFTWPLYAVAARARERCPFVVLVVTPTAATANWAAQEIDLGGGNRYRPLIVGPDGVPKLTDRARARREPQLAVLSVMAHGRGDVETATAIGMAAARAILQLPQDQRLLYSLLIDSNLSEAARKAIEMEPGMEKFFSAAQRRNFEKGRAEGEKKGRAEGEKKGRAEGKAEALLTILKQRGFAPTASHQRRIIDCTDLAKLELWLGRSLSVASVEELFASPSPRAPRARRTAPGNGRRRSR